MQYFLTDWNSDQTGKATSHLPMPFSPPLPFPLCLSVCLCPSLAGRRRGRPEQAGERASIEETSVRDRNSPIPRSRAKTLGEEAEVEAKSEGCEPFKNQFSSELRSVRRRPFLIPLLDGSLKIQPPLLPLKPPSPLLRPLLPSIPPVRRAEAQLRPLLPLQPPSPLLRPPSPSIQLVRRAEAQLRYSGPPSLPLFR